MTAAAWYQLQLPHFRGDRGWHEPMGSLACPCHSEKQPRLATTYILVICTLQVEDTSKACSLCLPFTAIYPPPICVVDARQGPHLRRMASIFSPQFHAISKRFSPCTLRFQAYRPRPPHSVPMLASRHHPCYFAGCVTVAAAAAPPQQRQQQHLDS